MREWILLLAAFCALGCQAGVLSAEQPTYKIGGADVAVMTDATGTLSVEEIASPAVASRFVQLQGPPSLAYSQDVVWLRLRLQRQEDAPQTWLLEFSNPFVNDLRLYSHSALGFTVAQAGDQYAFAERAEKFRYPVFALAFPDTAAQTFYLRLESDSSLAGELLVWQPEALRDNAQQAMFYLGLALGLVVMSFLLSMIHWLYSRERDILLFALLTVSSFFMVAAGMGLIAPVFTPTLPAIADLLVPWTLSLSTIAVGVVFGRVLRIPADFRRMDRFFKLAYAIALAAPFTRYIGMYGVWGGPLLQMVFLVVVCLTGWVSWVRWRSHARGAGFFFAAHLVLIGSLLATRMVLLGWLPANTLTQLSWVPGLLTFLFLAHAGIFVESQALKRERDAAIGAAARANEMMERERFMRAQQNEFFAFVAHELRTPLATMVIGLRNLEDDLADAHQLAMARVGKIKTYAQAMGDLLDRHLTWQRLQSASFTPDIVVTDPLLFAEESLQRVRALFAERDFAFEPVGNLPVAVFLDADLLRMALKNLLINAAKFSPAGTAISFQVEANTALHFRISDRGPGIQAHQVERLFALFNRMQAPGHWGGFGIGLAIARRVAHAHGGSLEYADRVGGGAVFTLSLPLEQPTDQSGSSV